jgi:hypothetical protein
LEPVFVPPSERLRRILLALTAALIAAQPMTAGTIRDGPPTPIAGLTLTLGWFVVFAGWALWQAFANPGRSIGEPIALGLLATAIVVAARTAFGTSNNWLSTLSAGQWLAVPAIFIAVRQLSIERDDARGLVAVMVATGSAALCVHLAPYFARMFSLSWPTEIPEPRLLPDGYSMVRTSVGSATLREWQAWRIDLFWLALALPAAIVFGLAVRNLPVRRVRLLGWQPLGLLLIGTAAGYLPDPPPVPASWAPAMRIAVESPGGVGPGLYDRFVVRHASPAAESVVTEPPNTYLGLCATAGWAALIVFLCTIALLGRALRTAPPPDPKTLPAFRPRWELQAGGLVGLLGGLVLQVYDWPPVSSPPFVAFAVSAAIRILVWFMAYTAAESSLLTGRADRAAMCGLLTVVGASVAYDVLSPGLAQPFWAAAAVAVNLTAPPRLAPWMRNVVWRFAVLLLAVGGVAAFVWTAYAPAIVSMTAERHIIRVLPHYGARMDLLHRSDGEISKSAARGEATRFITRMIIQPLADANQFNRRDAIPAIIRVPWYVAWAEHGGDKKPDPQAILIARAAEELDFEGTAAFLAEFHAHLQLARLSTDDRQEHFAQAQDLVAEIVRRDPPLEARLRYHLAAAYFAVKGEALGKREAGAAELLDKRAPSRRYRLDDSERRQIAAWLNGARSD